MPLRRLCPRYVELPPLIIGAMTPDAGYYLDQQALALHAHSFMGSLTVCLPMGIALLALFYAVRRPLWFLLPQPHRGALASLMALSRPFGARRIGVILISLLIGTWTHQLWDSFTHAPGWMVQHIELLQWPVFTASRDDILVFTLLQHLSTLFGVIVLLGGYAAWLRAQPLVRRQPDEAHTRRTILIATLLVSVSGAAWLASRAAASADGLDAIRLFVIQTVIQGTTFFAVLVTIVAVVHLRMRHSESD